MDLGLALGELGLVVAALALCGIAAGFLSGLLGIGGGGLLVPVLYEVFGFLDVPAEERMHLAIGTALAVMIPTSMRSFAAHRARGGVDSGFVARMAVPILIGVVLGSLIAKVSPGNVLQWVWVVFGFATATKLLFGREAWRLGDTVPKSRLVEVYGVAVGAISTIMSIGGGVYITTLLTLYGHSIQRAVGTSAGFGPLVAIPGMIGFIWAGWDAAGLPPGSIGYVNLIGFAAIVPTGVLMAPIGARVAHGISRRRLEVILGLFISTISLRFLVAALGLSD